MPKTDYSDPETLFPHLQARIYTIDGKLFFATIWLWEKVGGPRRKVSDGAAGSIEDAHAVIQECAGKYGAEVGADDIDVEL